VLLVWEEEVVIYLDEIVDDVLDTISEHTLALDAASAHSVLTDIRNRLDEDIADLEEEINGADV
jgi:hypothetical protein